MLGVIQNKDLLNTLCFSFIRALGSWRDSKSDQRVRSANPFPTQGQASTGVPSLLSLGPGGWETLQSSAERILSSSGGRLSVVGERSLCSP